MAFKSNAKDIRNIAFEQIHENYYWGKYGNFRVIIDIEDGYINAANICAQAKTKGGHKKEVGEWNKTSNAKDLKEGLSASNGIPLDAFVRVKKGGDEKFAIIRGTYMHPKLIPHITSWASPKFAIMVSDIVNEYFTTKALEEKEREIKMRDEMIVEKDKKILTLEEKMDLMIQQMKEQTLEMKAQNEITHKKLDIAQDTIENTYEELIGTRFELNEAKEDVDKISKRLDIAVEDRVPKDTVTKRNEVFALYRNNTTGRYKSVRCQWRNYKAAIARCREDNYGHLVLETGNPNPINVLNRLRERFNADPTVASIKDRYYIVLEAGRTEQNLIDMVNDIINEKLDV